MFTQNSGPVIGVFLYDIGGFLLPFEIVGFWCLICAFGILLTFPNVNKKTDEKTDAAMKNKLSFTDIIKVRFIITSNAMLTILYHEFISLVYLNTKISES